MPQYETYKESGAAWIGKIPSYWEVGRLKTYLKRTDARNPGGVQVLSLYRDLGIVPKDSRDDNHNVTSEDTSNYKYVEIGDFVVNKMKAWQGSVAVSEYEGIVSPAYYVYKFLNNKFHKRYFHYLIRSCYKDEFMRLSAGIRIGQWDLSSDDLDCTLVLIPPMEEQIVMSEFLDKKIAHIESLIEEAKASIEEYKAWKASIIYEAVTKGLDPNVEMKDSGVEWIGKIPIGWEVIRLKYFISGYKAGPFGSSLITDRLNSSGNVLVYTPEHIAKKSVDLDKNLYLPDERIEEMQQFIVETGDIIFPIVGSLGRSMLITEEMPTGIINQRLAKFKLDTERLLMDYFLWLFSKSSFYGTYIDLYCRGSIIVNLTKQIVGNMPIPLPANKEEQARICEYLESKCSKVDFMIAEKEALIQDLESYKKSLIFEVVTGKRKVV